MKTLDKYNSIDQSKLPIGVQNVLKAMKRKSNNFEDKKLAKMFEPQLDRMITGLKERYPEAIKGNDSKSSKKTIQSALDRIKLLIKNDPILKGFSNSDILRDATRKAKATGKRISKNGNVYYEYRENRIDRFAPDYPANKPLLEKGGKLDEITEAVFFGNVKNNKIKTLFGDKTIIGLRNLIGNNSYSSDEVANAIFGALEKNGRISTGYGSKTKSGLLEMVHTARYDFGGQTEVFDNSIQHYVNYYLEKGGKIPESYKKEFLNLRSTDKKFASLFKENDLNKWFEKQVNYELSVGGRLKSALMRDRKYFNKSQEHEVAYNKSKSRKGYLKKGGESSRNVVTTFEIDIDNISKEGFLKLEKYLKSIGLSSSATTSVIRIDVTHQNNDDSKLIELSNYLNDNMILYDLPLPFAKGGIIYIKSKETSSGKFYPTINGKKINEKTYDSMYDSIVGFLKENPQYTWDDLKAKGGGEFVINEDIKSKVTKKQIINHLNKLSHSKFVSDAAYILSADEEKIAYRSEDKSGRNLISNEVADKIINLNNDLYLKEIGMMMSGGKTGTKVRYIPKYTSGYVWKIKGVDTQIKGFGIFDLKKGQFTNLSSDKEMIPYTPAGGYSTAKEIADSMNKGKIKPEAIYLVPHISHLYDKRLAKGGETLMQKIKASKTTQKLVDEYLRKAKSKNALKSLADIPYSKITFKNGGKLIQHYKGYDIVNSDGNIEVVNSNTRFVVDIDPFNSHKKSLVPNASIKQQIIWAKEYIDWFDENKMNDGGIIDPMINRSVQHYVNFYLKKGGRLKSALMRDRKYFNSDQEWEHEFSKGKKRKTYKKPIETKKQVVDAKSTLVISTTHKSQLS